MDATIQAQLIEDLSKQIGRLTVENTYLRLVADNLQQALTDAARAQATQQPQEND